MDNDQAIIILRGLADLLEGYEKQKARADGHARAVEKHFTREFRRIENLEDDLSRKQILQENVNNRLDRERQRAAAAASTPTRKKRQRKKSLLRKVQVWVKRRRYKLRKLTRRGRGHAQRTRGSVPAVR